MTIKIITLSSDFEKQSYGTGAMEGVIYQVNPEARVIHLMHGIAPFNLWQAARTLETVVTQPIGCHVCVVDPGVGTKRRCLALKVKRGDFLIGPDNGLLRPAARLLGGVEAAHELTNRTLQREPVSPIFHGRDIFAMAAAHLTRGVPIEEFGPGLKESELAPAPYKEAVVEKNKIVATVIHINHFGSPFFNILQSTWDQFGVPLGEQVIIKQKKKSLRLTHTSTFGEVKVGEAVIMKDDFTRVEAAINQGFLIKKFPLKIGDQVVIEKTN